MSRSQSAPTWQMRDGRKIYVSKMSGSHMINCVRMVCRHRRIRIMLLHEAACASVYAATAPDGAADAAESCAEELFNAADNPRNYRARIRFAERLSPPVKAMVKRLKKLGRYQEIFA